MVSGTLKKSEENARAHFTAFYSHQAMPPIKTGSLLPPLIPEPVTALATVRHAVKFVHKINPGQISVITGDSPVYVIEKQLQWIFPTEFKDIVWMLGPFTLIKYSLRGLVTGLKTTGGQTRMATQTYTLNETHLVALRGLIH